MEMEPVSGIPEEQPAAASPAPDPVPAARRAYSKSFWNLAIFGLITQALVFGILIVLRLTGLSGQLSDTVRYLLSFIPMYFIAFPVYLLLSRGMEKMPPEQHAMSIPKIPVAYLMCESLAVAGALIGVLFTSAVTLLTGIDMSSDDIQTGLLGEGAWVLTVAATLFAPVIEEIIFRKVLIDRIRKYGDGTAILLSGLLFGLFHGNFTQFFYTFLIGLFFAYIYVRTGRIQYTIILHMILNTLSAVLAASILRDMDLDKLRDALMNQDYTALFGMMGELVPYMLYGLCVYAAAFAGLVIWIVYRKKIRVAPPAEPLPKGRQFSAVVLNTGFLVLIGYSVFMFAIQIISG